MSDTTLRPFLPRLVLEQQPDGSLIIESYLNGMRHREVLDKGFELYTMLENLAEQKRAIESKEERARLRREQEEKSRHRRVWTGVAYGTDTSRGHGAAFADKTINGGEGFGPNCRKKELKPKKPAAVNTLNSMDFL